MHEWCLVQMDSRRRTAALTNYWSLSAAYNEEYAAAHGYGYAFVHLNDSSREGCKHATRGVRSPTWCKVPALALVLLHGVPPAGRPCKQLLYLDTDAHISNFTLNIDEYLARARDRGDDALQEGTWSLLFSSNYWWNPAELCAGVFFARNSASACGILRRWWDANFPLMNRRPMHEQGVLNNMYGFTRPWGSRLRLLSTARFFRREDEQWRENGKSWQSMHPSPSTYFFDDFIHHGLKASVRDMGQLRRRLAALVAFRRARIGVRPTEATGAGPHLAPHHAVNTSTLEVSASTLTQVLSPSEALDVHCPPAQPEIGTASGYDQQGVCCTRGRERLPSRTHINGTRSTTRRPCWIEAPWARRRNQPHAQEWGCGAM